MVQVKGEGRRFMDAWRKKGDYATSETHRERRWRKSLKTLLSQAWRVDKMIRGRFVAIAVLTFTLSAAPFFVEE